MELPAVADITSHGIAIKTNRQAQPRSGTACSRVQTTSVASAVTIAWRGRNVSDRASSIEDPTSRTRGPPNMLRAVSTGDPVAAYMIVPRARLAIDPAITIRHWATNRTRNCATANNWR